MSASENTENTIMKDPCLECDSIEKRNLFIEQINLHAAVSEDRDFQRPFSRPMRLPSPSLSNKMNSWGSSKPVKIDSNVWPKRLLKRSQFIKM